MNTSLTFSLSNASVDSIESSLDLISASSFGCFELSGAFFESESFSRLREAFFKVDKKVSCIQKVLPSSLTRNWIESSSGIQSELKQLFIEKLIKASAAGISELEVDFAFDSIREGDEINQVNSRCKVLRELLPIAVVHGISIVLPLRTPKEFPKSLEWRLLTMLANQVLHSNIKIIANVFPFEMSPSGMENFFKKTFYAPSAVRFCFDGEDERGVTRTYFQEWLQILCDQGFSGDIILAPTFSENITIESSLKSLAHLQQPYEFD